MNLSQKAQKISSQINPKTTKLGDLRVIAKEIKKDHELAMELWSTAEFENKGYTPNYLPEFIAIQVSKLKK
jgi:3-methyladenine DNA glycosylase AlkD